MIRRWEEGVGYVVLMLVSQHHCNVCTVYLCQCRHRLEHGTSHKTLPTTYVVCTSLCTHYGLIYTSLIGFEVH